MNPRTILPLIWLALVVASVLIFVLVPAEGDGFTRGENRLGLFLGLHLTALFVGVALIVFTVRNRAVDDGRPDRRLHAGYPQHHRLAWPARRGHLAPSTSNSAPPMT